MLKIQPVGSLVPSSAPCSSPLLGSDSHLTSCHHFQQLCQAMPVPVLLLDDKFQVVMANGMCLEMLGFDNVEEMSGVTFDLDSGLQNPSGKYQNIKLDGLELPLQNIRVDANLMATEERDYFVVTLTDLSRQNRKRSMEQIFFHDILNTAGGMHGMSEVLLEAEPEEITDLQNSVHSLASQLIEEITAQRDFVAAENGDLKVNTIRVQSNTLLQALALTYSNHPSSGEREIAVQEKSGPLQFISDPVLLNRVLANMIKNAMEASLFPEMVTLQSLLMEKELGKPRQVTFSVHNPSYIPEENQEYIFQHSFTTKGTGRGLGTFSMRILAEKYLGGQVSFSTDPATGTTFSITLPLAGP